MSDEDSTKDTERILKSLFDSLKDSDKEGFSTSELTELYEYAIQTSGSRRLVGDWDTDRQLMCLDRAFKNLTNNRFCLAIYKDQKPIKNCSDNRLLSIFDIHVFDTEKQKSLEFLIIEEQATGEYSVSISGEDNTSSVSCSGPPGGAVFFYMLGKCADIMREIHEFTGIGEAIMGFKKNE